MARLADYHHLDHQVKRVAAMQDNRVDIRRRRRIMMLMNIRMKNLMRRMIAVGIEKGVVHENPADLTIIIRIE